MYHTAVLTCQLHELKDHEEYFLVICNHLTMKEIKKKLSKTHARQTIELTDLSLDTQYAAHIVACDKKFHDIATDGESVLFSTTGMCNH